MSYTMAGAVCLVLHNHPKNVEFPVVNNLDINETYTLKDWFEVDEKALRTWKDKRVAAENAAYGLAGLLIFELTEYELIERAVDHTGIDFWLGKKFFDEDKPFKREARLEVSGIFEGNKSEIKARLKQKLKQTGQSDHTKLPAYAIIVEFSKPMAQVIKK
jgi:hypothetical protein